MTDDVRKVAGEAAVVLRRAVDPCRSGELSASTVTRAKLEGSIVAPASTRIPTPDDFASRP